MVYINKAIGQIFVSTNPTVGLIVTLYLIDHSTGEIIYSDSYAKCVFEIVDDINQSVRDIYSAAKENGYYVFDLKIERS